MVSYGHDLFVSFVTFEEVYAGAKSGNTMISKEGLSIVYSRWFESISPLKVPPFTLIHLCFVFLFFCFFFYLSEHLLSVSDLYSSKISLLFTVSFISIPPLITLICLSTFLFLSDYLFLPFFYSSLPFQHDEEYTDWMSCGGVRRPRPGKKKGCFGMTLNCIWR